MLIEFTVGNYRSIRDEITLSMSATALREDKEIDQHSVIDFENNSFLRSAVIYGPNASGKSNIIRALFDFKRLIMESATKMQTGDSTEISPFILNQISRNEPSYFQLIFIINGTRYRYGVEVDKSQVYREWLYRCIKRERPVFLRQNNNYEIIGAFKKEGSASIQKRTRNNALFLSVLAQFNSEIAINILEWFENNLILINGLDDIVYSGYTVDQYENDEAFRDFARNMMQRADIGITDIIIKEKQLDPAGMPVVIQNIFKDIALEQGKTIQELKLKDVNAVHPLFENQDQIGEEKISFNDESNGTQKFFSLLGPFYSVRKNGGVLVIDEMEARLHPLLTQELVKMMNSKTTNPNNAQLIFTTHDVNFLGEVLFRRDQIWFVEKDKYGESHLYSLAEIKERNTALFLKNYLKGYYGAVPRLSTIRPYLEQEQFDGQGE